MYRTEFDVENKIWSGNVIASLYNPNISVGQVLLWMLQRNPTKIAQISHNNGIQLTNAQIRIKTIRAAQNLTKLGYQEGDIIGIVAKNNHNLAPIIFASLAIGCPFNTLDPAFKILEIEHMFKITKPKLVFCDVDKLVAVQKSLKNANLTPKIFTFGGKTDHSQSVDDLFAETNKEENFIPVQIKDRNQLAAIVCSSGTTGLSKGVCLTHAALLDRSTTMFNLELDDVTLCFSTLYSATGILTLMTSILHGCTRVIINEPFSPDLFLQIVEKYKVTFYLGTPSHLAMTLKSDKLATSDISSIKYYTCGGSMVSQELCEKMRALLPHGDVYILYGLTEIIGLASLNYPPKKGSVGYLTNRVQAKIINDEGQKCGPNEDGEVCLKVPFIFQGYFGDKKTTENAFDSEGWFITGDLGHFDEEGYLFLVDRKKDIFKYGGRVVSPSEIEDLLINHPAIEQVCVVGVPDADATDLPTAVVIQKHDAYVSEEEISNLVAEKMTDCKKLRGGVYFVEKLPMTPSGKIVRRLVKEMAINFYNERQIVQ